MKYKQTDICLCDHPFGHHSTLRIYDRENGAQSPFLYSCGTCKCSKFELNNSENSQKIFLDYRNYLEIFKDGLSKKDFRLYINAVEHLSKIGNFHSKLSGSLEHLDDVQLFTLLADNKTDELTEAVRLELRNRGRHI